MQRGEALLLHVPLFRTVYAPVKQLIDAFSPNNELGFKRMVLVEDPARGFGAGVSDQEFTVDRGHGPETLLAVYVPTNHLYLGDIVICPPERVTFPELSVEEGMRVFLTGGMGLPEHLRARKSVEGDESAMTVRGTCVECGGMMIALVVRRRVVAGLAARRVLAAGGTGNGASARLPRACGRRSQPHPARPATRSPSWAGSTGTRCCSSASSSARSGWCSVW